jgi:hypothetical protein
MPPLLHTVQLDMHERYEAFMDEVSQWSPIVFAALVTLVIAPPLVLHYIVLPCWECADFEAAVLHEAGHFFGLGHPDNVPRNLYANLKSHNPDPKPTNTYQEMLASGGRTNESNCHTLWEGTMPGVPPGALTEIGAGKYPVRNSVMEVSVHARALR